MAHQRQSRGKAVPPKDSPAEGSPAEGLPVEHRSRPSRVVSRRAGTQAATNIPWAELHCHSSYSFLDGAATPDELVAEAARLGLEVLALTDHDGMYGVPQFAQAAARLRETGVALGTVFGAELSLGRCPPARPACPTRKASICWSWPATRKATPGCAP